jgi:hypothetical protein
MAQLEPQAEARAAFLFSAARALDDDERARSKQMKGQAEATLADAEKHGKDCRAEGASLTERRDEVRATLDTDMAAYETGLYESLQEGLALGPACDDLAHAGSNRAREDRVAFQQDKLNLIDFVLIPQAHERTLKANVKVSELRHLIASLTAILHHDERCKLIEPLRLFEGGNVAIFGAKTAELRAQAAELLRLWKNAENELAAYQKSQAARQSARMAGGLTRAEIVAGNIARRTASNIT